ncbi:MAG: hypothetical protein LIP04_16520 [Tannerellaceae bacterium]|nr:hypothetical protein [Tannerellaceae bacterium]
MKADDYDFVIIDDSNDLDLSDAVMVDMGNDNDLEGIVMIDESMENADFITLANDTVMLSNSDMIDVYSTDIDDVGISFMV